MSSSSSEPDPKRVKTSSASDSSLLSENDKKNDNVTTTSSPSSKQQTKLGSFFTSKEASSAASLSSSKRSSSTKPSTADIKAKDDKKDNDKDTIMKDNTAVTTASTSTASTTPACDKAKEATKGDDKKTNDTAAGAASAASASTATSTAPLVPTLIQPNQLRYLANWESHFDQHVIVRKVKTKSKDNKSSSPIKIAAFDVDGTLVNWTIPNGMWPSKLEHYELWSSTTVISKLRSLYDNDGYQLLLVSNQGGVQKAHTGKKATTFKSLVDWIAHVIDRPIQVVVSTRTIKKCPTTSYHKPTPKLWNVAKQILYSRGLGLGLGQKTEIDLNQSFFVGDSADPNDEQGGVDYKFAQNVGIKFYTPDDYFGPSDLEKRQQGLIGDGGSSGGIPADAKPPPIRALHARAALIGGYVQGPVLLILCGVQGSGKSTFCQQVLAGGIGTTTSSSSGDEDYGSKPWIVLSQDTINNGKPGKREKVEREASMALRRGQSVIIDRMHLSPQQREYFYNIAIDCNVPAHVVLLNPSKDIITRRIKLRTNHPGKVEGSEGVKVALRSLSSLIIPTYDECQKENSKTDGTDMLAPPQLISCTSTSVGAARLAKMYRSVLPAPGIKDQHQVDHQQDGKHRIVLQEVQEKRGGNDNKSATTDVRPITMPIVTMGTMGLGKRIAKDVVKMSYSLGYRGIDTAPTYKNEDRVGEGLHDLPRGGDDDDKMSCIVKIPKRVTQPNQVREELFDSLDKLQLSKRNGCDLLLLHWPCDVIQAGTLSDVWKEMEECQKEGLCKALGVCNFNAAALSQLLACCSIRPVVNQVERHPLLPQWDLIDYCARKDIVVQAHTPLGQGKDDLLQHSTILEVVKETSLTPGQVVLQWNIQQGVPVVPKFSSKEHARELFQLLADDKTSKYKLSSSVVMKLNEIGNDPKNNKRFVVAPFMYGKASYCWGHRMLKK